MNITMETESGSALVSAEVQEMWEHVKMVRFYEFDGLGTIWYRVECVRVQFPLFLDHIHS